MGDLQANRGRLSEAVGRLLDVKGAFPMLGIGTDAQPSLPLLPSVIDSPYSDYALTFGRPVISPAVALRSSAISIEPHPRFLIEIVRLVLRVTAASDVQLRWSSNFTWNNTVLNLQGTRLPFVRPIRDFTVANPQLSPFSAFIGDAPNPGGPGSSMVWDNPVVQVNQDYIVPLPVTPVIPPSDPVADVDSPRFVIYNNTVNTQLSAIIWARAWPL